jgi:4-carboxymuconolactone decarboxylase
MTAEQRRVADAITGGMRDDIPGPLLMWLLRPELADRAQSLGEYARYKTSLPPELSEIAILTVARYWGSEFEWYAHKQIALAAGVSPDVIESIRCHQEPSWQIPEQAIVNAFTRMLLETRRVTDDVYDQAVAALGQDGVVDLVGIVGYYSMISMTINVFDVPLPADVAPEL